MREDRGAVDAGGGSGRGCHPPQKISAFFLFQNGEFYNFLCMPAWISVWYHDVMHGATNIK